MTPSSSAAARAPLAPTPRAATTRESRTRPHPRPPPPPRSASPARWRAPSSSSAAAAKKIVVVVSVASVAVVGIEAPGGGESAAPYTRRGGGGAGPAAGPAGYQALTPDELAANCRRLAAAPAQPAGRRHGRPGRRRRALARLRSVEQLAKFVGEVGVRAGGARRRRRRARRAAARRTPTAARAARARRADLRVEHDRLAGVEVVEQRAHAGGALAAEQGVQRRLAPARSAMDVDGTGGSSRRRLWLLCFFSFFDSFLCFSLFVFVLFLVLLLPLALVVRGVGIRRGRARHFCAVAAAVGGGTARRCGRRDGGRRWRARGARSRFFVPRRPPRSESRASVATIDVTLGNRAEQSARLRGRGRAR